MIDLTQIVQQLLSAVPSGAWALGGGTAGATLTHLYSRSKFQRERIWEARLAAYSRMLSSVDKAHKWAASIHQSFQEYDPQHYFQEAYQDDNAEMWKHINRFRKIYRKNMLLMSKSIIINIDEFERSLDGEKYRNSDPPERHEARLLSIKTLLAAFEKHSRQHIRLPRR